MRQLRGVIEAWLKHRVWSVYDAHGRAYLILGGIACVALRVEGDPDPWVARSSVWGIVLLVFSATVLACLSSKREP
jgi:hypothetical protein